MKKQSLFLALAAFFLIVSCSDDTTNRTASEYLSAYMKNNKNVVLFGKVDVKQILEKTDYKNIPKAAVILKSEMKEYESALELSNGVCFAMEGPFDKHGNPASLTAFLKVKNSDSLASKITSLGLPVQVVGDLEFVQENEISIGIKNNLAIFISKAGKYDGQKALIEAFVKTEQDVSEGKVDKILAQKGDVIMGVSFENLYASSNTSLAKLDASKKKEFESLVKDSYIQSSISFEKGQAVFLSENLFSNELMNRMFMKDDPSASILKKLGTGNARLGIAMNLDMNKMENFLNDFAPDFKRSLTNSMGELQLLLMTMGDKPLTNMFNGQFGMVMVGDMMRDGSLVPEANIHLGLGNKGKELNNMVSAFFPATQGIYGMNVQSNDKEINIRSGKSTMNSLVIPQFANSFGKHGFTAFVNFDGMDMQSLDLDNDGKFLYALQNITVVVDNKGSKMVIKGKNQNQNILKQIVDVYVKDLEETIGKIN